MKLSFTALALSAPSVFAQCTTDEPTKYITGTPADGVLPKTIETPGTFYYFTDFATPKQGFKICPTDASSGTFTITDGDCVLTDGCVTSPGWPGDESADEASQSCVFSGVTSATLSDFATETSYDYLAWGDCVPENPIGFFQDGADTKYECDNKITAATTVDSVQYSGTFEGKTAYSSNRTPLYPAVDEGLYACLNVTTLTGQPIRTDETGTYSESFYGCQKALYSAPGCQEADLVDINADNAASFTHDDTVWQGYVRGFGLNLPDYSHSRVPNVISWDPSGACQGSGSEFFTTTCACLEGYCAYYECPSGSYAPQGALTCSGTCAAIENCNSVSCTTDSDQTCTNCAAGYYGPSCGTCTNDIENCNSVSCTTDSDQTCTDCAAGYYGPSCGTCTAIENCNSVSCTTDSDQTCTECADGYSGEGTNACAEIPSGQAALYVVTSAYTFNSAFTSSDIPAAKQDVATAAGVETSQVHMEIRAEARKKRAEGDVIVDVTISFPDFATAQAKVAAFEATPIAFTTVKAANAAVTDPVVAPYVAATKLIDESSAPVFVGSLVMAILALF